MRAIRPRWAGLNFREGFTGFPGAKRTRAWAIPPRASGMILKGPALSVGCHRALLSWWNLENLSLHFFFFFASQQAWRQADVRSNPGPTGHRAVWCWEETWCLSASVSSSVKWGWCQDCTELLGLEEGARCSTWSVALRLVFDQRLRINSAFCPPGLLFLSESLTWQVAASTQWPKDMRLGSSCLVSTQRLRRSGHHTFLAGWPCSPSSATALDPELGSGGSSFHRAWTVATQQMEVILFITTPHPTHKMQILRRQDISYLGFSGGASGTEPACQCRRHNRHGSTPGSGRSPGGGHGNPPQYSCPENPMDRRSWQAMIHRVSKSWTWLKQLNTYIFYISLYPQQIAWALAIAEVSRFF